MKKNVSESSPRVRQRLVRKKNITLTDEMSKEISALKNRKINLQDKDAPEIANWNKAIVGKFYRPIKKQITIRVDADVLDWFRHTGKKYQSLMNQACREYMEYHLHTNKMPKSKKHGHAR